MLNHICETKALIGPDFPKQVIPLLELVKHTVKIIVFDWRWYPHTTGTAIDKFNQAIIAAAKRNVKIQAIVNSNAISDILKKHNIQTKKVHTEKLVHTKMMILDDRCLIIGSHNYTQNAFSLNLEASAIIKLPSEDNEFSKYFDKLWSSS